MLLKEIVTINKDKINCSDLSNDNYISTENLFPNFGGYTKSSNIPNGKCTKIYPNSVLLSNIRPYFKKVLYCNFFGGCSNDIISMISSNKNILLNKYLFYIICSDKFINLYVKNSKGTKMPRGDINVLLNYDIEIPNISTQQHIVDSIGSVDDAIEKNEEIISKLVHMGDLMLNECNSFVNTFDIACIKLGGTPSRNKKEYWNGKIAWINSGAMTGNTVIEKPTEYITEEGVKNSATKSATIGDTVLSIIEPSINKVSLIVDSNVYFNQSVICLSSISNSDIGIIFFATRNLINEVKQYATGSAQQSINKDIIANSKFKYSNDSCIKIKMNLITEQIMNIAKTNRFLKHIKCLLLSKYFD